MQGQPALSVDCGASKRVTHIKDLTGHVSAVAWKHSNDARINYAVGNGKGTSNPSTPYRNPFDTTPEIHVVLWITPSAVRQMEIKAITLP